jgi:hypothetical protein
LRDSSINNFSRAFVMHAAEPANILERVELKHICAADRRIWPMFLGFDPTYKFKPTQKGDRPT